MIRTLHVFIFCGTWALIHAGDNWLAIRELGVRVETLRLLQELQQRSDEAVRPSIQVDPGDNAERPRT